MSTKVEKSTHWADITADKVLREKGEKEQYTCASGITPSGTVHIGNFREIISVDLVVRALRDKGRKVRFLYSWDEYDVFRKVPKNMPQQELLETYLRKPIVVVPDVIGGEESYAAHNEKALEALLPLVGIEPEYIYQAKKYRKSDYAKGMKTALDKREEIMAVLNEHRTEPLKDSWYPVSVFCTQCDRDTIQVTGWDGDWSLSYECSSCGNKETLDLRETGAVSLFWRIDWPMRWAYEGVDFEPAGKDHHSEGGSFDTSIGIVRDIYGGEAPVTFQYDFVRIKAGSGKISSSSGEVISLDDMLKVYQPEVIRFLFAGTRPNSEFAISFDLDVLKVYEDYDKCERTYFNKPETPKALKKWEKQARIYELSQTHEIPEVMPYQIQIRHLCNLLQINSGDIDAVIESLGDVAPEQVERLKTRAKCAWLWVTNYAPEDFKFFIREEKAPLEEISAEERELLSGFRSICEEKLGVADEKAFAEAMYDYMKEKEVESAVFFALVYRALISKEKGPRLVSFLHTIKKETVLKLL